MRLPARSRSGLLVLAAAAALLGSGCGGDDEPEEAAAPETVTVPADTRAPEVSSLERRVVRLERKVRRLRAIDRAQTRALEELREEPEAQDDDGGPDTASPPDDSGPGETAPGADCNIKPSPADC